MRINKKTVVASVAAATLGGVVAVGSAAVAFVTVNGISSTLQVEQAELKPLTITASNVPAIAVGEKSENISVGVSNPNTLPVSVNVTATLDQESYDAGYRVVERWSGQTGRSFTHNVPNVDGGREFWAHIGQIKLVQVANVDQTHLAPAKITFTLEGTTK